MNPEKITPLTDVAYWDRTWAQRAVPAPLNPDPPGLNGEVPRRWHGFFAGLFARLGIAPGDRLLEAGAGGSVFLPYFAQRFGLLADGIDNSPEGCELSQAIAARAGTANQIMLGDVFDPPAGLCARYRVVFSMGLAEHFRPTTAIIAALARFLEPGGWLVTAVPNMHGLPGALQRVIDPVVFAAHVPLSPAQLAHAHQACGLAIVEARHLMSVNLSVLNFDGPHSRVPARIGLRAASWLSKALWIMERAGLPERPNRITSPWVTVVARASPASSP